MIELTHEESKFIQEVLENSLQERSSSAEYLFIDLEDRLVDAIEILLVLNSKGAKEVKNV